MWKYNIPKEKQGKGLASILDSVACNRVAKLYDCKVFHHKQLKILTPKQMLQKLSIALAQVKAANTSNIHLIHQLTKWNQKNYIFCVSRKKITKEVPSNIMNSTKF